MTVYAYCRVSSKTQNLDYQIAQFEGKYDVLVTEKKTGVDADRELFKLIEEMEEGDTLKAVSVDRISRSTAQFLKILDALEKKGCFLVVLRMGNNTLDTSDPSQKFFLSMMSVFSEMERNYHKQRQRQGIESAKERGVYRNRKRKIAKGTMLAALDDYEHKTERKLTVKMICEKYKISRSMLYLEIDKKKSTET